MMIFTWLILALIAGALAKLITPGRDFVTWSGTPLLGIGGLILGREIANRLGLDALTHVDLTSVLVTTLGAMIVYVGYRMMFDTPVPSTSY